MKKLTVTVMKLGEKEEWGYSPAVVVKSLSVVMEGGGVNVEDKHGNWVGLVEGMEVNDEGKVKLVMSIDSQVVEGWLEEEEIGEEETVVVDFAPAVMVDSSHTDEDGVIVIDECSLEYVTCYKREGVKEEG